MQAIPIERIVRSGSAIGRMKTHLAGGDIDVQHPARALAKRNAGVLLPAEPDPELGAVLLENLTQQSHRPGLPFVCHRPIRSAAADSAAVDFRSRRTLLSPEEIHRDQA